MPRMQTFSAEPALAVPVTVVAELQDSLLAVMRDLQRLEGLLTHATTNLMERFDAANALLDSSDARMDSARDVLHKAVTELQFHDMASQLIGHTRQVLQGSAFRLASASMGHDEEELEVAVVPEQPERPNPVTQGEMHAGSIELF